MGKVIGKQGRIAKAIRSVVKAAAVSYTHLDVYKRQDPLRAKYIAETYLENPRQVTAVRNMFGYTGTYKEKEISVMGGGMGMPSVGIYSYEPVSYTHLFANHKMFKSELGENYVIASCYNGLLLGGGAYTLCRLVIGNIAKREKNNQVSVKNFK